ncbi:hypothetical protein K493DRAFT_312506 [Basidiobolus meristosporus CBS 931.73]|uniref:Uncharacterized protein n=1 Tax=Basidiobolus meristosporus CBS 931.73 TaxID=1314790 RepID=A0A1Y1YT52_9FUNG|nr:hypothetical protein K493DRAFT_312506 [Basidiobolus meristosporus CBS 931.73]|eukprot:ORY01218.1 hypothetical protein K493DRAFT_312506 [Basidiobolus meristosporus CBS 931.73]
MGGCLSMFASCRGEKVDRLPVVPEYSNVDPDDNLEFENLLNSHQNQENSFLSGSPFRSSLVRSNPFLRHTSTRDTPTDIYSDEEDNLFSAEEPQAELLDQSHIQNLSNLADEHAKLNEILDAELEREEEELRLAEERELEDKREAAQRAAREKGLLDSEQEGSAGQASRTSTHNAQQHEEEIPAI